MHVLLLAKQMLLTARLLTDPEAPARIRAAHQAISRILQEHREHEAQLECWENEGGPHAQSR